MDNNPSLRIHIEEDSAREERLQQLLHSCLPEAKSLADQFEATTGWLLNYRPGTPPADLSTGQTPTPVFGRFEIADLSSKWPPGKPAVSRLECERLLSNINQLVARIERLELLQHQDKVTLIEATEDSPLLPTNISDKVANLLRFAKSELSGIGAAVYLLDEATTHLRLRSMIAPVQFAPSVESVRALENSLADLESLIGNKVNIHSVEMGDTWRIPQPFRYGWCVMLGTKNLPLGTIWIFFSQPRSPEAKDFDFLEGLNNNLFSEINSREKPQAADAETALLQQELLLASRSNDARLPSFAPEVDGWKIAGWTYRQGYLASTFHDWAVTPAGNLSVAVGQVVGPMLTSAMSLNNLRSLISAHRDYRHSSLTLAAKLNEQIWCNSPGDEMASLVYALVDPETDQIQLVNAGDGGVVFCGPFGVQSIDQFQAPLGVDLDTQYEQWEKVLEETETLVLFTQGLRHAISESMPSANDADLLRTILLSNTGQPHAVLSEIEERFFNSDFQHVAGDLSVVVLSRSSTPSDLNQVAAEVSQGILAELRADDCEILEALVKRIEGEDDWDYLSEFGPSDSNASEFERMWSEEPVTDYQIIPEDDHEGESDEEVEQIDSHPSTTAPEKPENDLTVQEENKKRRVSVKKAKDRPSEPKAKATVPAKQKTRTSAKKGTGKSTNTRNSQVIAKSKAKAKTRATAKSKPGPKNSAKINAKAQVGSKTEAPTTLKPSKAQGSSAAARKSATNQKPIESVGRDRQIARTTAVVKQSNLKKNPKATASVSGTSTTESQPKRDRKARVKSKPGAESQPSTNNTNSAKSLNRKKNQNVKPKR